MSPVISGIIGAAIASYISYIWLQKFPYQLTKREQRSILQRYKASINFASIVAVGILILAIILFKFGVIPNHWTWGLFLIGGALASPLLTLFIPLGAKNHSFREAHAALAIKSHSPISLQFFCIIFGLALCLIGGVSIVAT